MACTSKYTQSMVGQFAISGNTTINFHLLGTYSRKTKTS